MKSLSNRRLLIAALISLIAHAVFFLLIPRFFPEQAAKKAQMAALEMWMKEKPVPKKPKSLDDKKMVVSLTHKKSTRPDKADFFAEHDQTALKQTKSHSSSKKSIMNSQRMAAQEDTYKKTNEEQTDIENERGQIKRNALARRPRNKKDPLGIRPRFEEKDFKKAEASGNGFADYLPNVEEGKATELNAWQWRHAPFFNRIKTRISQTWSPQEQISRYDPNGAMLGHKDRVTVMLVTIDREGFLKDLIILNKSGVAYLDEEAVRAFREAAPFLYPPKELFADKDEFSFTFAFHLQQNRGFSFDFNW